MYYYRRRTTGEYFARELLIGIVVIGGMKLFWSDVQRCAMYEGILKMIAVVGLANILIPCLWLVAPPAPTDEDNNDEDNKEGGH